MAGVAPSGVGMRVTPHPNPRKDANNMAIVYDAELAKLDCCTEYAMTMACIKYDRERSYLFLREHSLETNIAFRPCLGMCGDDFCGADCRAMDAVHVQYFDRPPFDKSYFCFCIPHGQPVLEVVDGGFMCCCTKLECCGKQVGLMPFETTPCFPLALCGISFCDKPNRVVPWDNLFGLMGPVTGKPLVYLPFAPQPADAESFVAAAKPVIFSHVK